MCESKYYFSSCVFLTGVCGLRWSEMWRFWCWKLIYKFWQLLNMVQSHVSAEGVPVTSVPSCGRPCRGSLISAEGADKQKDRRTAEEVHTVQKRKVPIKSLPSSGLVSLCSFGGNVRLPLIAPAPSIVNRSSFLPAWSWQPGCHRLGGPATSMCSQTLFAGCTPGHR